MFKLTGTMTSPTSGKSYPVSEQFPLAAEAKGISLPCNESATLRHSLPPSPLALAL